MPLTRIAIPAESDILCEQCGYTLNGLPEEGRCPECGKLIAESTTRSGRSPPAWETDRPTVVLFARTVASVVYSPKRFFRALSLGGDLPRAKRFARGCMAGAAVIFATGMTLHFQFMFSSAIGYRGTPLGRAAAWTAAGAALAGVVYAVARLTSRLVVWLTSFEARYWGYRLPASIVRRGLQYQSAAYLPAAGLFAGWVVVGRFVIERPDLQSQLTATGYLYVLCGVVVAAAVYLFMTYATAMRKLMYANRPASPSQSPPYDRIVADPSRPT